MLNRTSRSTRPSNRSDRSWATTPPRSPADTTQRSWPSSREQRLHVARVRADVVAVVGRQRRVAEAAQVGRDHLEAGLGERRDVAPPDPARLGPAVDQQQREAARALAHRTRSSTPPDCGPRAGRIARSASSTDTILPSVSDRYDPKQIEPRWQQVWADERTWEVSNEDDGRPKSYVLEMLPYPSGEPHIGHLKVYSVGDAIAHFRRRNGHRVLHPMGYDAFGLPAENHAIKTGQHPRESTEASIAEFRRQFRSWGISIDWSREFGTHEPSLLPLDPVAVPAAVREGPGLPQGGGGQLVPQGRDRARQRAGDRRRAASAAAPLVEPRQLEQWFFRITDYADRLLDDLETIDWPAARRDDAAQLDRPLRGRRGRVPLRRARTPTTRCSPRGRTRCSAPPSS